MTTTYVPGESAAMPSFARLRPAPTDVPLRGGEDDAVLVARSRDDPLAFATLYDRYLDAIFGYCVLRLGRREVAEDATSVIFSKALAGLPGYRGPSFRAWLFGIAHHVVIDFYRTTRGDLSLDAAHDLDDPAASPEDAAIASESTRALVAALAQLTSDQRQVIELRLAGLTGAEIGAALGRSQGAIAVTQHRAMRRLRQLLTPTQRVTWEEVRRA
ncbi:MAG: sigma-70 family RNA polymerase sigma factor [Thermomicrobiales bacterium]